MGITAFKISNQIHQVQNRVSAGQKTKVRYVHKDQNKRDENDS